MTPKPPSATPDFVMPTGKPARAPRRAPRQAPSHTGCPQEELTTGRVVIVEHDDAPVPEPSAVHGPGGLLLAPPDTTTSLTPELAVPATTPSFSDWLTSPTGRDCADPRFLPQEPSRRQAELERRLKLAWGASREDAALNH